MNDKGNQKKSMQFKVGISLVGLVAFCAVLIGLVWSSIEKELDPFQVKAPELQGQVSWWDRTLGEVIREKIPPPPPISPKPPGPRVYLPPQWPASSTINWELRNQLPKELVEKIDQSPVPVLLPGDPEVASIGTFVLGDKSVSVAFNRDALSISLLANPVTVPIENIQGWTSEIRGLPAFGVPDDPLWKPGYIYDGSWKIHWAENGIVYYIDINCLPEICPNRSFIIELIENLRYVGGKHAQGGA